MTGPVVLVVTHWFDPTADVVVGELGRRGAWVFRFDAADFPRRLRVTGTLGPDGWACALRLGSRHAELADVSGIYFRRPTSFSFGTLPEPDAAWAREEARAGLGGLLMAHQRWLNHPHHLGYAEYKPVQLAEAARAGLRVPKTLITNDPGRAREFTAGLDQAVYKQMSAVRPPGDGEPQMLYTSVVEEKHLAEDGGAVAATAHMFQERIQADYAVRLTVVDDRMFAAAIRGSSPRACLDWRSEQDKLTYEPVTVPEDAARGTRALMRAFSLRFGAFDFLVTDDGGWVFLEVNPNGQWAWIEQATGMPIAAAISDALTSSGPLT
ncbi:MAG: ATP-grasp ribosomal peptide maturase [Nocardiopsaceae bacterium]|nr:ATP-grasp ribosomal peptide maturase [Nocardiopsaceae bacterium]